MTLATLIPQDNFERIRDRVAEILAAETAAQRNLAAEQNQPCPDDWFFRVYTERSSPWADFKVDATDPEPPIVNVWFESDTFDEGASNVSERSKATMTLHCDCYGRGLAKNNPSGGHIAGDELAARIAQRTARLVRAILMSTRYTYLGFPAVVWRRRVASRTLFQPQQDDADALQVVAARVTLEVGYNEFGIEEPECPLEELGVTVRRTETGEVLATGDFDYTT